MNWAHVHLLVNEVPIIASLFAVGFLFLGLVTRERAGWVRAALFTLVVAFASAAAAFLSGSPALEVIEGMPRTSGKALMGHHVAAVVAVSAASIALVATIVVLVVHKRRGFHPRWSIAILFAAMLIASGALVWTGSAGGRINHPEIQKPGDLDHGPARPH